VYWLLIRIEVIDRSRQHLTGAEVVMLSTKVDINADHDPYVWL
jgi:hypothetical protein